MIGAILLLAVVVFGLKVLFGKEKAENYYSFLVWLVVAPILLSIGFNHVLWFWYTLPSEAQILALIGLPFLAALILRRMLPNAAWLKNLSSVVFELLIYVLTFPIRLIWRAGRQISERERGRLRLQRYHPAVGGRPPLKREREKGSDQRQH